MNRRLPSSRCRGRPRKFGRPSRAVTVTLPEDVLARLRSVDGDLGRAIVTLVERRPAQSKTALPAEISSFGNHAVIVVTPVKALQRIPGVELVPIGNGRCLISLVPPHSIPQLELDIRDVLAGGDPTDPQHGTLAAIAEILRTARASGQTLPQERTIIVLESRRNRRRVRKAS